jgi:hypothetical protein
MGKLKRGFFRGASALSNCCRNYIVISEIRQGNKFKANLSWDIVVAYNKKTHPEGLKSENAGSTIIRGCIWSNGHFTHLKAKIPKRSDLGLPIVIVSASYGSLAKPCSGIA